MIPVIEDKPLAFCDFRTIDPEDLIATDRIYPHSRFENYYIRFNSSQKWYWVSRQTKDELLLMMMYDSISGDNARYCPHNSFDDPSVNYPVSPRESVETRSIVIQRVEEDHLGE